MRQVGRQDLHLGGDLFADRLIPIVNDAKGAQLAGCVPCSQQLRESLDQVVQPFERCGRRLTPIRRDATGEQLANAALANNEQMDAPFVPQLGTAALG